MFCMYTVLMVAVLLQQLTALRGSIPEDFIPSSSRFSSTRGLPPKDVLEFALPELNLSCLKLGNAADKTCEILMKLDEQSVRDLILFVYFTKQPCLFIG